MSENLFAPESTHVNPPHIIEGISTEAKQSFYDMVRSRVHMRDWDEHMGHEKLTSLTQDSPCAFFLLGTEDVNIGEDLQRWVSVADVAVNIDYFTYYAGEHTQPEDFTDLIPFVIEHEIYEMWLIAKKGMKPTNTDDIHMLARRKESEMAAEQGKLDRLVEFYKKTGKVKLDEIQYAYDKTMRKMSGK